MPERVKWQLGAWGLVAALVVFAGYRLLGDHEGPAAGVRVEGPTEARAPAGRGGGGARDGIYVHVAGQVRRPGLYRVPRGSRIAAAVARAGGPARDSALEAVNLAQRLRDGQQVLVPRRGQVPAPAAGPEAGASASSTTVPGQAGAPKISLSTASVGQLDELDGIGPTLAQNIVEYRDQHGGFRSIGELQEVDGIGAKRFAELKTSLDP